MLLSKSPQNIIIPSIALYEMKVGIAKSNNPRKREKQLSDLVSQVAIAPFRAKEAEAAATIRATLEGKGTPIGLYDTLIAGIALSIKATLVTNNTKEFKRIETIIIEDWL